MNTPFLLKMIAAGLVLSAAVFLLHWRMVSRNAGEFLKRADAAERAGKLADAAASMRQYLRFRPGDIEARERYAGILERAADSYALRGQALGVLEDVLQRDPGRTAARRRAISLAVGLRRYGDARTHLDLLLADAGSESAELVLIYARCEAGLNRPEQAAIRYLRAADLEPTRIEPYAELAGLLVSDPDALVTREVVRRSGAIRTTRDLMDLLPEKTGDSTPEQVAEAVTTMMVERAEPAYDALLARAVHRRSLDRLPEAAADVARALELSPPNASGHLMIAAEIEVALARAAENDPPAAQRHLQKAQELAERGLTASPPDPQFRLLLSELAVRNAMAGTSAEALASAERHLTAGIEQAATLMAQAKLNDIEGRDRLAEKLVQLRWGLTDLLITRSGSTTVAQREALGAAKQALSRLRAEGCREDLVELLECRLLAKQGRWKDVAPRLERIRVKLIPVPDLLKQADLLLGECYGRLGNPDRQVEAFRRAKEGDRLWAPARIELARALAAIGRTEEAISEYRTVLSTPGVPLAAARVALVLETARPAEERRLDRVNEFLDLAEGEAGAGAEVAVLRAEVALADGKADAASRLLDRAAEAHSDDVGLWQARVRLASQRADIDVAARAARTDELIRFGQEKFGDRPEVRVARAMAAVSATPESNAANLEALADDLPRTWGTTERLRLYEGLLRVASRAGDDAMTGRIWKRIVAEQPDSLPAWLGAASYALDAADDAGAAEAIAAIRRIEGDHGPNGDFVDGLLRLRRIAVDGATGRDPKRLAAALREPRALLESAAEHRPYWSAARRALGILEQIAGDQTRAFEHFERAFVLGDRSKAVALALVEHHKLNGRFNAADAILRQIESDSPDPVSGDLAEAAWRIALERGQVDAAIGWAERLAEDGNAVKHRLALADLLFAKYRMLSKGEQEADDGRRLLAQTRSIYEHLIASSPNQADVWFAYVVHLWRVGDQAAAMDAISEAQRQLPDEPKHVKPLAIGRLYAVVQDREAASRRFDDAVSASPTDPELLMTVADFFLRGGELDRADVHLDRLLDPETAAPQFAVDWARRRKALSTAARGSYLDVRRALAMLRREADEGEVLLEDLRVQVAILSPRTTFRDRIELSEILEQIAARSDLAAAEKFRLATLYDRTGQWAKAKPLFEELIESDRGEPAYLAEYVAAALEHETHDASLEAAIRPLIERLAALEPSAARTAMARARVAVAFDTHADAAAVLLEFSDRGVAADGPDGAALTPDERIELRATAELAEELGLDDSAEALYQKFAERRSRPEDALVLATYYGRQGRHHDGLDVCERHAAECSVEATAITAVNVVSLGQVDDAALQRAEAMVDAAIKSTSMSPRLIASLAGLRATQGRVAEAEALYRTLLAERPDTVSVLNNLAWLLAVTNRNPAEASELVDRAIEVNGPIAELLDTRGLVSLSKGQPDLAVRDFEVALRDSPSEAIRIHLALAYERLGRTVEARQAILAAERAELIERRLPRPELAEFKRLMRKLEVAPAL